MSHDQSRYATLAPGPAAPPRLLGRPIADYNQATFDDFGRLRPFPFNRVGDCAELNQMGGVDGNWDILPRRAITLGMYELLMSKKIHLTFMRSWHAGVLRRALFGPVTGACPGSFVQEHPQVEVTVTRLAARVPSCNVAQATGEGGDT